MKIRSIINGVYRQTAPDVENGVPSVSAAEAPADPTEPEAIVDDPGQDTIPEEVNLWNSLNDQLDEPDDDDLEDSPEAEPLSEPEPEPEAPAAEEETPEAEIPAEVEPTAADTAVPTEPEVQPTPEPEPIPQPTEEEASAARTERRTQLETSLTDRFQLSDDEALQLVTNPGKVFPKLQARMFTDMWLHVEAMVDQRLPSVIENTNRSIKARDAQVDAFFNAWPQLNRETHGAQVAQVAAAWSAVNPNSTADEVTRNVGMQVAMMNGISPDMTPTSPQPQETEAEVPSTPHRPAAVNGARQVPQQSHDNAFTAMSYDLDEDED